MPGIQTSNTFLEILRIISFTAITFIVCSVNLLAQSDFLAEATQEETNDQERIVQFSFEKADWSDVIPWFAEQTNYSWQPISQFPEGTFTLFSDKKYTPIEALDQLNYALRLQEPQYTIIRNRDQLILTEASSPLPVELIPKVSVEELDQRGDYEVLSCQFELGDVSVFDAEEDLMVSISEKYSQFAKILPVSNEFYARGTGADLKKVRDTIRTMTQRKASSYSTYTLKHYDPEQFMIVARRLLKIAPDGYEREDGSLIIVVDPSSNRLIVKGTPTAVTDFKGVAEVVDVAPSESETGIERSYLKSYPVLTDPETAFKVLQTMLDGTTATVGQDEVTGAIVLRGTEDQHKIAMDTIKTLRGETGTTKIVELKNATASEILSAVNALLNISATSAADNPNAPKILANTALNYIVIRGTPPEIFEISQIIAQLDNAEGRDPDRVRTNARVIELSPDKRDQMLDSVEDYWPSTGRKNSLRIIMPDEKVRDKLDREFRRTAPLDSSTRSTRFSRNPFRTAAYQQPETSTGSSSTTRTETPRPNSYIPPAETKSVAGAEISIKATPFGVLISSDDLDALDDLEDIFRAQADDDGIDQGLTIFYLKFKKASSLKPALEKMFGLSSGASAGGSDLMSGIVDNMAGGGTGDLLGGLLGSGASSSDVGAITLTGDVQIGLYSPLNLLYVSGATASDLNYIQDAIDLFDQPTPPQNPELAGQFFTIQVRHRDPEEVLNRVQTLLADYISGGETTDSEGGGRGGNNGVNEMAKLMRGMTGGGEEGNGDAETEELPKVRIDLDKETSQILITGPKFIYEQILKLVQAIDTPDLSQPKPYEVLPAEFFTPGALEILKSAYGSKISVVQANAADETDESGKSAGREGATEDGDAKKANENQQRQQQLQAEIFRNLRRNNGNGGGGQRGGGGGGQRGGGGGGGGGQRGGGGGGGGQRGGGGGGR